MSIIVVLKFLHYLALFLAGGLGVANGLLAKAHQMAGEPPAPPVQQTMMKLARLGLVAIILLWVTGIGLSYLIYSGFAVGWAFHMKLLGATILLGSLSFLNVIYTAKPKKRFANIRKVLILLIILFATNQQKFLQMRQILVRSQ